MSKIQRVDHDLFGDLICAAFHHGDGFFCAGDDEVQIGLFHLGESWVDDQFFIDISDPDSADGAVPGNIGNHR